ncbi:MAG: hypothetical protein JWN41_390, partial [Thermoleophilia bacterium]|nr:hypothetical protein [Thermoleophilia bacterium]
MPTSSEHPDSYAVDLEQVLAAVAGRDDTALIAVEHDHRAADALVATIAATDIADVLVDLPRPDVAAGAHPGRLLMYAMARQFRYDGDSLDLAPDYLEALNESLDRDAPAWAAQCAVTWTTWICHQGEPALGWPIAKLLLERYADRSLPALLLSSFAALAERVGDVDAAAGLWDAARLHHDTISSARTRWFVEYEWARVHLLQSGGAPGRASVVLERVQAGLAHADDAPARFLRLNACLEHAYCLCFIGRADDALASTARARVSIAEADAEFLPWLSGVDSLANALSGRIEAAQSSLDEVESAATDTTTLELAATLPARAIIHSVRGDIVSLRATLDAARVREHEHLADAEQRVIWRLLGAWALMHAGRRSAALDLLAELEQVLE